MDNGASFDGARLKTKAREEGIASFVRCQAPMFTCAASQA